jgi:CelD/BcsL family acetyltransferase involved in cellulose biosynthesis
MALLLRFGSRVEIAWAASEREHDRYGVNMLLYWAAIEHAIRSAAEQFDFGRSTPGTGNARFKLQWGPREEPLEWSVRARSKRGRATERGESRRGIAAAAWRRLPASLARRIGPLVAARIPL